MSISNKRKKSKEKSQIAKRNKTKPESLERLHKLFVIDQINKKYDNVIVTLLNFFAFSFMQGNVRLDAEAQDWGVKKQPGIEKRNWKNASTKTKKRARGETNGVGGGC